MPLPLSLPLRRLPLVVAIALAAAPAATFADPLTQGRAGDSARVLRAVDGRATPYLIRFDAPSLAAAAREGKLPGVAAGKRADLRAAAAVSYLEELRVAQHAFLQQASGVLGRPLTSVGAPFEFRHAYNGMVVRVTAAEARQLAALPGVAAVQAARSVPVSTDRGPQLIGAPNIWNGTLDGATDRLFADGFDGPATRPNRGEGIVAGIVDTGLNFANPSFAATSGDYQHVNPLGAGHYLGLCGPLPSPDWTPQCNDKVIGAYDFVTEFMPDILANDPGATNGPGPVDENGHGSHTASTVAGNPVVAQVPGGPQLPITGVAPRANLIVYNACYTTGDGRGSCLYPSLVASINQAVADGIVDVLNYSIAGGSDPWNEEPSQAFLDAVDADIFVAASAGNSGPSSGSTGHAEPWVTTAAASTHGRGAFVNMFRVTGPAPVPPALEALPMTIPTSAIPLTAPVAGPLAYNVADPLQCSPATAGSYTGKVVLIRRGTCTFIAKVQNAEAGGAAAVVMFNNVAGDINPNVAGATIPVAVVTLAQAESIAAFYANTNSADVRLDYPSEATVEQPDRIARFSSRGPTAFSLLKPDIAAPGSNILAAYAGDANSFGVISGTSMASPHIAGAAALIRKAHPEWTPAEVKSALMLTSKNEGIVALPSEAAANPFDMGAGRVRADLAIGSGLVMNETSYRYLRADPARGGDPGSLNVPSLGGDHCVGTCTFTRSFRNVGGATRSWNVSLAGIAGSATPSTLILAPGASGSVSFALDVGGLDQGAYTFGEVGLTPDGGGQALHLPAAVFVDPFKLELTPARFDVEVAAGGTATAAFAVRNLGNAGLTWNLLGGVNSVPVVNQAPDTRDGLVSSLYVDANNGAFVGDDIVLDQPTSFQKLSVPGFLFANFGDTVDMYASSVTWSIYADAGGKPSGYPGDGTAPLWTLNLPIGAPGVDLSANALDVDLDEAGVPLDLDAGKYWLVAYPQFDSHVVNGVGVMWFRFLMGVQANGMGQAFNNDPEFGGDPANAAWEGISASWDGHYDAAMIGTADRQCTPSWATPATSSGAVGAGVTQNVQLSIDATGLTAGEHIGQLCVASNDPAKPITLIPIKLTVTP
ncbi:S8 family serine peptidase [Dokdonella sp.]|uniref:S8 family serine peptidase n=1 Tax=Dokdonella sp. TaxID=2291710 RepID=UPI001B1EEA3C|nr:S8 family serine peptidase [Dokdonella sp.]MBO9663894.1 S8 family serine peptidase [Dokdonella sp.]